MVNNNKLYWNTDQKETRKKGEKILITIILI